MIEALDIHVTGIVQGVGFRPFVYRMAKKYLINGWVLNAADGVNIHAEGESRLLDEFVIEGIETTIAFHRRVLDNAMFCSGDVTTDFIETQMGDVL